MPQRFALLLLLTAGCGTGTETEVLIGIATDLQVPSQLDHIRLEVNQRAQPHDWQLSGKPSVPYGLPASFAVYTDDGSEPIVSVEITGALAGTDVIHRRASFALAAGKALFMRMALESRCLDATGGSCPGDKTCIEGNCVSTIVDNATLPSYQTDKEKVLDCQSGSVLLDTGTGQAMRVLGNGTCPAGQRCCEGTCYLGQSPCEGT